jgi:selenocysteine-specific elongation factor
VLVEEAGASGVDAPSLRSRTGLDAEQISQLLSPLLESGKVLSLATTPRRYLSGPVAERLRAGVLELLLAYHRREPLREGLAREEIRTRLFSESHPEVFRCLLADLAAAGRVRIERDLAALATHRVAPSPEEIGLIEKVESAFRAGGTNPPELGEIARSLQLDQRGVEKLLHLLLSRGRLTKIPDGKIFHAEAIDNLKRSLWSRRTQDSSIDIAAFKDLAGTSRKNAIPLLEHLDQIRVTRREGSRRVILPPPPASDPAN